MTVRIEVHELTAAQTIAALQLAEGIASQLQAADADPFMIVAVAASLVGGYAAMTHAPIDHVVCLVGELAKDLDDLGEGEET